MLTFNFSTKQYMLTSLEAYEGFTLHLHVPLLAQDDLNHYEKVIESSIKEINMLSLEICIPK